MPAPECEPQKIMKSYIRKSVQALSGYTPGEQPTSPNIIKLNTNENPYPPSLQVQEVMARMSGEALRVYPDPNCLRLREEIAALHGCSVDQVIVGNGSDELLALCTRALVERDGTIAYWEPSYSLYPVLAAIEGLSTRTIALNPDFSCPLDQGLARENELFFWTNPNAPTGLSVDSEDVEKLCASSQGVVIMDEAYADFAPTHCMALALRSEQVLVARSLSKSYGLAGIRLGYMVGPQPLIAALYKIKDSYNVNRVSQEIGLAALRDQAYMQEQVQRIRVTRARLERALDALDVEVYPSSSNFVWARPRHVPAETLFRSLREQGVLVRHFPGERTGAFLRISVGTEEQVDGFLGQLENLNRRE